MTGWFDKLFPPEPVPTPPTPKKALSGRVERASVYNADDYFLGIRILLEGERHVYHLIIPVRRPPLDCMHDLTQAGDEVTFSVDENGRIDFETFQNITLDARLGPKPD